MSDGSPPVLRAGFGTCGMTPDWPVELSGFAARTGLSKGVHDPLHARAAAFDSGGDPALLIALDVIGTDDALTLRIREAVAAHCPVEPSRVAVTATHTHGGPAVLAAADLGEPDERVLELIVAGAAVAARRALDRLTPCEARFARGFEGTVASNRRDPDGPVDHSLDVIRFDNGDTCLGLIVSHACHPVVLGADNLLITRDYPGFLTDALEAGLPGATVMFLTGAAGQLNTGHGARDSWDTSPTDRRSYAEAERIGRLLAEVALDTSAVALDRPALSARPVLTAGSGLALAITGGTTLRVEAQALGIGGHALALFPGEVFTEYGLALKERFGERVTTLAYANCAPGYLPTDAALEEGGYEVADAHRYYGQGGPFAAGTQDALVELMADLVTRVLPG